MEEQGAKTFKKIVSGIVAAAMIIGGAFGLKSSTGKKKDKSADAPVQTTIEDVKEDYSDLYLAEDFNIDNKDEVKKRAEAIYNISEKKYSVEDIMNAIYLFNGKPESMNFKSENKEEMFQEIQKMFVVISDLFMDNYKDDIAKYSALMSDDGSEAEEMSVKNDIEPKSHMLKASTDPAKNLEFELSRIIKKQLKNINNNASKDELNACSAEFYNFFKGIENSEISSQNKVLLGMQSRAALTIFVKGLSEEQRKEVENPGFVSTNSDTVKSDAAKKTGCEEGLQKIIEEGIKKGTLGKPLTPDSKGYNKKDAEKAKEYESEVIYDKPIIVDEGGKKPNNGKPGNGSGSSSKPIGGGENTTSKEEEVATIPPGYKPPKDEIIEGGDVVDEWIITSYDSNNTPVNYYVDGENSLINNKSYKKVK